MLTQKRMHSFLDGKIRNQLVRFKSLTGHGVKPPHRLKVVEKYGPLVGNPAWGDHRVSEDIKCDFATEMVRYFCWSISLCSLLENFLELI